MEHRALDYDAATPVTELGDAALDDLLDRGDLEAWMPLARAVRDDPDGPMATTVARLCRAHQMYGTSALWTTWIGRLRSAPQAGLGPLRRSRGLTQSEMADRLGVSQSDVSKLERRGDARVSTLASYVEATGGRLELHAVYPDGTTQLRLDAPGRPARAVADEG